MFLRASYLVLDATMMSRTIEQITIDNGFNTTFIVMITEHWLLLTTVGIVGVELVKTQSVIV